MSVSDSNAIVPIKKRRFPLIHSSPSPSQKEISPLPLDDSTTKVGDPCVSDGPAASNPSTNTTSELSERNKIFFSEESEKKSILYNDNMVLNNIEPSRDRLEEDDACFNGYVENEEKYAVNDALYLLEKPMLKFSPTDLTSSPRLCAEEKGDEIDRKKLENCTYLTSLDNKRKVELSVGLKEHLVPELVPEGSNWKCEKQINSEPVLLNLGLRKQGSYTQCSIGDVGSDYDGSHQRSNRENWDLNTSMESWEGCASAGPSVQISVVQTNKIVTTHRCSTEMVTTEIPSGKQTPLDQSDNLHLSLSSSDLRPATSQEQSSSVKLDFRGTNPYLSSPCRDMRFDDLNVALQVVKPEPFVEGSKLEFESNKVNGLGLSDDALVNHELDYQLDLEIPNASNICSSMKIENSESIKSESVYESKQEAPNTVEGTLNLVAKQVLPDVDKSCPIAMPVVAEMSEATRKPSCSTGLTIDEDISNHSGLRTPIDGHLNGKVHQGGCGGELVNSEMIDVSKVPGSKDSSISVIQPFIAEDENQNNTQWHPLKPTNEQCFGLQRDEESSVSDEEKISISADILEEDVYSSEYESDGMRDADEAIDAVDNDIEEDYEDGEVREPILKTQVENSVCDKIEVENFGYCECSDDEKINSVGLPGIDCSGLVSVKQENKSESHDVEREDNFHPVTNNQSSEQEKNEDFCLKELLVEENTSREHSKKGNKAMKATSRSKLLHCEKSDTIEDRDISSDKTTDAIEELVVTLPDGDVENVKTVDFGQNNGTGLSNVKEPVNDDDVTKDFTGGSIHNQIVNQCQTSTSSSPSKTRSNTVRSVLTRTDRELIPDTALKGGKLQPQERHDMYSDVSQKVYVNRHQSLSPRENFARRRGRFAIQIDSLQDEWDFNPTISPGIYNDQIPYRAPRRKYVSAVSNDDIDQSHYKVKPDGPFCTAGHRGRKILDNEDSLFCHMPSRRKSPGRRDGPPIRGVKMVHRIPRNISPNRYIREAGSELVRPRHSEKFVRTLEDETMDPIYAHPHPPYEIDRPPFIRERRNFSIQRNSYPRIDSKSPGRSRGRSPGQWFPSKRKSDQFCGHPDMTHRSSPGYRVHRMRSPRMHGEMEVRRHGFPFSSMPSNDLRDMGSSPRDHGHMRSGMRGRNRTDRLSFRNRRFDDMDPRDRIESSEYFDEHVHSGQLNEVAGDGEDDDQRRFFDRREHMHSFRPQYNDSDGENFHNNVEESRRPYRYCAENELEFHERGKLREREFDRPVKNQPGNLPRRTGVIEEHEVEDYRHSRQLWDDHGFEDMPPRMKRKRF